MDRPARHPGPLRIRSWHRRWRSLIGSDLLAAWVVVILAVTAYLPLFLFNVVWFLPMALLPRGVLSELLIRLLPSGRITP